MILALTDNEPTNFFLLSANWKFQEIFRKNPKFEQKSQSVKFRIAEYILRIRNMSDSIITLDVGGQMFKTQISTLTK